MSRLTTILIVSLATACGEDVPLGGADAAFDAPPTFVVSITARGLGTGTVVSTPAGLTCGADCTATFPVGTTVTLTAAPAAGTTFDGWSGGCSGLGPCVVADDTVVVAAFVLDALVVTRSGPGGGRVTSLPAGIDCGADCDEVFPPDTVVTLAAQPAAGSELAGWSGGGCSGTGTCIVTVDTAVEVDAMFTQLGYKLDVVRVGAGTGVVTSAPPGINCGPDCSEVYPAGAVVTLTATPGIGSTFTGWTGDCSGPGPCAATMNAPVTVTAHFAPAL